MSERYHERELAAVESGLLPAGRVAIVEVAHDAWCPKMQGGACTCEPTMTATILGRTEDEPAVTVAIP
jgi:hypothetical protein